MDNQSGDEHPVHTTGAHSRQRKLTTSMPRYSRAETDFVADDRGQTFFHCHYQDHMD
jgi:FtsP/CotA-like multicopper oxidase with cupredoxin domain